MILRADGSVETCGKCAAIGTNRAGPPAHAPGCPGEEWATFAASPSASWAFLAVTEWWESYRAQDAANTARWQAQKAKLGLK